MTVPGRLVVWTQAGQDPVVVGTLDRDEAGPERLRFAYGRGWLEREDRFAVSRSLPLDRITHEGPEAGRFFANLLPEGQARRAVAARLGLSEDNDWSMLVALGGDCAGALSLLPEGVEPPSPESWAYDPLSDATLAKLARREVVPLLLGGESIRLSLAGAQDKLPVAVLDGALHLPVASAPSTHILKLPSRDFAHLAHNEALLARLAAAVGLPAAQSAVLSATAPPSLLVERFDRAPPRDPASTSSPPTGKRRRSTGSDEGSTSSLPVGKGPGEDDRSRGDPASAWPVARLHQEDLCQALGLPPAHKYEAEGGPSLADAAGVVRRASVDPLIDMQALLRWAAFNAAAGNADGHGKNLALLHGPKGIRLAPFYDLVSTRHYRRLDRKLAMGIGGHRNMDTLGRTHWEAEAKRLRLGPRVLLGVVRETLEAVLDQLDPTVEAFGSEQEGSPLLQTLPRAIRRRTEGLLRRLDGASRAR